MAWDSDLKEAVYTAPSGEKFSFHYDSKLSSETDLKTATFTFPERDGALVVPLGVGGRRFSFTCFFYGRNSKKEADNFESALKQRGYGELIHPLYGIHKVVPTGTISRNDDVVNEVGVSNISITFAETIISASPLNSEVVSSDVIKNASEVFEKKSVYEFINNLYAKTVKGVIWAQDVYEKGLKTTSNVLKTIANVEKEIYTKFQIIESEIYSVIDNFIGGAEDIAVQTIKLIRLPGQTAINARSKVEGYSQVADLLIEKFKSNPDNVENAKNQWVIARFMLEAVVVSCACSIAENISLNFETRDEAVNNVLMLLDLYDDVIQFEEQNVSMNYFVETGDGFNYMRDIVSYSVQKIINDSFSLPTQKIEVLSCDRQLIELVYSFYGDLSKLNQFILNNKITYNELEIIPMGRKVVYYV